MTAILDSLPVATLGAVMGGYPVTGKRGDVTIILPITIDGSGNSIGHVGRIGIARRDHASSSRFPPSPSSSPISPSATTFPAAVPGIHARTRLFVNAFQPSFKLAEKERDGARVRKRYHAPATPCDRLLADPRTSDDVRRRIKTLRADLDPVRLLAEIRSGQQALVAISESTIALPIDTPAASIPVADFLAGMRTAWRMGKVRPTAQPTLKPKRGRRRPDPLIAVTDDLRSWFEADPAQTGSELLLRLQTSDPDRYPDGLLRTVQRRLKIWRSEIAHQLVFGTPKLPQTVAISGTYA